MELDIWSFIITQLQVLLVPALLAVWVFVFWLIITWIIVWTVKRRIIGQSLDNVYAKKIAWLVGTIISNTLLLFNILVAFQIIWLDVSILMAGISFGIGFAMQQILSNMISWIMIITNPTLETWKVIQLLWGIDVFASIETLTIRYVIVRTFDRQRMIIPNTIFIQTPYKIYDKKQPLKQEVTFHITHETDIQHLQQDIIPHINNFSFVAEKEKTQILLLYKERSWYKVSLWYYFDSTVWASFISSKSDIKATIITRLQALWYNKSYNRVVYEKESSTIKNAIY